MRDLTRLFITEEERWDAFTLLRRHWESLAGEMPMRNSRLARRDIGFDLGPQIEEVQASEPISITLDEIRDAEVEASTAGLNRVEPEGARDQIAAEPLHRENFRKTGGTPSKKPRPPAPRSGESPRAKEPSMTPTLRSATATQAAIRKRAALLSTTHYEDDHGWAGATLSPDEERW